MGEGYEVNDSVIEIKPIQSVRPKGSKSIRADNTGLAVSLPWSAWLGVLAVLFGGGSGAVAFKLVTTEQLDKAVAATEKKQTAVVETLNVEVKRNTRSLKGLGKTVAQMQATQQMDIAVREARRVVDENVTCNQRTKWCRDKMEDTRERIRRTNMRLLKAGKEPCADVACR